MDLMRYALRRRQLHDAGVHAGLRAGIHGQKDVGAFSIVMAGGYEDDVDCGDVIYYVGTGGQETAGDGGPQKCDQSFEHSMNKALVKSIETQQPVRVIRGWELRSLYAPKEGYRYDGLYRVRSAEMKKGRSGYQVCVFKLRRISHQPPLPPARLLVSECTPRKREKRARDKDDEAYKPPSGSSTGRSGACRLGRSSKRRICLSEDEDDEDGGW
ncbi:hypothetical protein OH77DRAFT_572770 [Trametes cingulata]|nr:hypothetical protein OH77DRAFT_572770 [Trametes cingulata]